MNYFFAGSFIFLGAVVFYWLWTLDVQLNSLLTEIQTLRRDNLLLLTDLDNVQEHFAKLREQTQLHNRRIQVLKKMVIPAKLSREQKDKIRAMGEQVQRFDQ